VTVGEWLSARTPAPPEPLAERLRTSLGVRLDDGAERAHDAMLATAQSLLAELLALECARRDRALDLLAVDALVTYAFEAAAEQPDSLAVRATAATTAIATLPAMCERA
jgi:hypothetical protein